MWRQPGHGSKRKAEDTEVTQKRTRQAELGSRSVVFLEPQVESVDSLRGPSTSGAQNQSHINLHNQNNAHLHANVFDEAYARFPP